MKVLWELIPIAWPLMMYFVTLFAFQKKTQAHMFCFPTFWVLFEDTSIGGFYGYERDNRPPHLRLNSRL